MKTKIAVMNATKVSIAPVDKAAAEFPDVEIIHFMDEGMSLMAKRDGKITGENLSRMISLIDKANAFGVDGILLSCTIFSPYAQLLANFSDVPLVASDVATFEKATKLYKKIGVVVSFEPTLTSVAAVIEDCRKRIGPIDADIRLAKGAFEAAGRGDDDEHNRLVLECARSMESSCDAIVLSQMSQMRALPLMKDFSVPVLSTPPVSIESLLELIHEEA